MVEAFFCDEIRLQTDKIKSTIYLNYIIIYLPQLHYHHHGYNNLVIYLEKIYLKHNV